MEFGLQLGQAFRNRRKILRGHQAGKIHVPKKISLMHEASSQGSWASRIKGLFLGLLWPAVRFKGVQRIELDDTDEVIAAFDSVAPRPDGVAVQIFVAKIS